MNYLNVETKAKRNEAIHTHAIKSTYNVANAFMEQVWQHCDLRALHMAVCRWKTLIYTLNIDGWANDSTNKRMKGMGCSCLLFTTHRDRDLCTCACGLTIRDEPVKKSYHYRAIWKIKTTTTVTLTETENKKTTNKRQNEKRQPYKNSTMWMRLSEKILFFCFIFSFIFCFSSIFFLSFHFCVFIKLKNYHLHSGYLFYRCFRVFGLIQPFRWKAILFFRFGGGKDVNRHLIW